jgi:hypothetical protein
MVVSRDKLVSYFFNPWLEDVEAFGIAVVQWESGHDETVEVNQRALIDKVLARYSGEFTVFRELLQNSDDARSEAVEIRFETQAFLSTKPGDIDTGDSVPSPDSETQLPDLRTTHVSYDPL